MSERDSKTAKALFHLLREKASLVNDLEEKLVSELKHLFMPMKDRFDEELMRISGVKTIFDQVEKDELPFLALKSVVEDPALDEQKREHARMLLQLSRGTDYDLKAALLSILAPVKQRCLGDLELVSQVKSILENDD